MDITQFGQQRRIFTEKKDLNLSLADVFPVVLKRVHLEGFTICSTSNSKQEV